MKKIITNLFLGVGLLLIGFTFPSQSSAQNSSSETGVKVYVQNVVNGGTKKTSRIDFLNTNHENIVFTWSLKDKNGKITYTSGFVELKAGSTFSYPNSKSDGVDMLNKEIKSEEISISLKQ